MTAINDATGHAHTALATNLHDTLRHVVTGPRHWDAGRGGG